MKSRCAEGDILSIDFGVVYNGFHGDAAITVPVGKIDSEPRKTVDGDPACS